MPDLHDDEFRSTRQHELSEQVGAKEARMVRARHMRDKTLWVGLGMFGVVGWSVAAPTLIGIFLGLWLDRARPGPFSWTLALLLAGATLGSLSAWYWISSERRAIDDEQKEIK